MKASRKKIDILLARKCLNRKDLAQKAGIPVSTATNVISGANVQPATLGKVAKALNVDVTELLEE